MRPDDGPLAAIEGPAENAHELGGPFILRFDPDGPYGKANPWSMIPDDRSVLAGGLKHRAHDLSVVGSSAEAVLTEAVLRIREAIDGVKQQIETSPHGKPPQPVRE